MLELAVGILSVLLIAVSQLLFKAAASDPAGRGVRAYLSHLPLTSHLSPIVPTLPLTLTSLFIISLHTDTQIAP